MGFWETVLITGVVSALAFGIVHLPRFAAYPAFVAVAVWPIYALGAMSGWSIVTILGLSAIIFMTYALLYWAGSRIRSLTYA